MATKIMGLVVYNIAWAEAYLGTKWHLDPSRCLTTTDMGQKLGAVPFLGGGSWVPIKHNVAWAEAYLHAKFDPQYTNVTDRTGQTMIR